MNAFFNDIYRDKVVLITGHTGFKGSWLALWLTQLGAEVIGYALEPPTEPNHFDLINLDIVSTLADVRDSEKLNEIFQSWRPEIVFHLAAQPLVRYSYVHPTETFETNIMGAVNVFEACRNSSSVRAVINITSDKCYENKEWIWGYRENDAMGGFDPYSASKGCSELITSAYRCSFFNVDEYGKSHQVLLASARAGNVIGGGDWREYRIIPDLVKAASKNEKAIIRNPNATRPWQYVLDSLSGYLQLGRYLLEGQKEFGEAWNFGPSNEYMMTVREVVENVKSYWNRIEYEVKHDPAELHEAGLLKLDCSKANSKLKWKSVWDGNRAFEATINWYKAFYEENKVQSLQDLNSYIADAISQQISWTQS